MAAVKPKSWGFTSNSKEFQRKIGAAHVRQYPSSFFQKKDIALTTGLKN